MGWHMPSTGPEKAIMRNAERLERLEDLVERIVRVLGYMAVAENDDLKKEIKSIRKALTEEK